MESNSAETELNTKPMNSSSNSIHQSTTETKTLKKQKKLKVNFDSLIPENVNTTQKSWYNELFSFLLDNGVKLPDKLPQLTYKPVDLYTLYHQVQEKGGFESISSV